MVRFRVADMLQREDIDLVIGPLSTRSAWRHTEVLVTILYSCVEWAGVIGKAAKLPPKATRALLHVIVTYRGIVDVALALRGLQRRVVCAVLASASVLPALKAMPAVATVPKVLADSWRKKHSSTAQPGR